MIEIDGSEGGGQWIRTALCLSTVTGKPFKMDNIRGLRDKPGLKTQHLKGLNAVAELCNARIEGNYLGSKKIEYYPGEINGNKLDVRIETAGSIGLLFQTLQIPVSQSDKSFEVNVNGGATFGKWAPTIPYIRKVLLPNIEKLGVLAEINVSRHGFYPKGGARVKMRVEPCGNFTPIELTERDEGGVIKGISVASEHLKNPGVAKRQALAAEEYLTKRNFDVDIDHEYVDTFCPGSGITLWYETGDSVLGSDSVGERGKSSEKVGREAAREIVSTIESNAPFDKYMADQILTFLALATENGPSKIRVEKVTEHCRTNLFIIEKFLPVKYSIQNKKIKIKDR
ncbi:MAG: RNA 3'-terminal phosphate cyclase [Candidatus Aenigmatarchaeota archaeon]